MKRYISAKILNLSDYSLDDRLALAGDDSTIGEMLEELANDPYVDVRYAVSHNMNTPVSALKKLSHDPYYRVRYGVLNNFNCPQELIQQIQSDIKNCDYSGDVEFIFTLVTEFYPNNDDAEEVIRNATAKALSVYGRLMAWENFDFYEEGRCCYSLECGTFEDNGDIEEFRSMFTQALLHSDPPIDYISYDFNLLFNP